MIGNKFAKFVMATGLVIVSTVSSVGCAKSNYQDSQNVETYVANCELRFTTSGLCVDLAWDKMQTDSEYGIITLKFYVKENPTVYVDPTNAPFLQLFMPSMGHGSSPTHVQKTAVGIYQVTNVFFSMPGNWDIRVQLKDGSKVIEQVIQKFNYTPFY